MPAHRLPLSSYAWPKEGHCRIPYWVYWDPFVYEQEQAKIFRGPTWNYVGLEAELPNGGDFKTTFVGDTPVIVCRDHGGAINVLVNKCAHRGTTVCREPYGHARQFTCIYHQWCYDLKGNLVGVPFRSGVVESGRRVSGMPEDFKLEDHSMLKLKAEACNGVIFASFDQRMIPFRDYLGAKMFYYFERVFDGRELQFLGRTRQKMTCNWKLVFENIKDYHATLLHVFLVTFGLYRADQKSKVEIDDTGRHSVLVSRRGEPRPSEVTQEIGAFKSDYVLHDPSIITGRKEFKDEHTVVMQTVFPNLIIQQQTNTLALRQIVPLGPKEVELVWDFFGYRDDDAQMLDFRLKQSSLMGPAGLVTIDYAEAVEICQRGAEAKAQQCALLEMGGREVHDTDYMVTEAALRGFYRYYREIMGFE
ncbi:MAG TPA: Rieske 2Fe-2S domain-containing protein [Candidatus Acidoferrales bacterium]|nr:Rieske 2Fe-2S domain-containing protein [Candidatus Acidoferrales bacterium]